MPKGHRSVRSQGYYRLSPVSTPTTQYAPISSRSSIPNSYYSTTPGPLTSMSQQSYTQSTSGYPNGGPVQHPMSNQQYAQMAQPQVSIRPSSGAWNPNDDQTLMAARAQGMNWQPIQQAYFPTKTPNACRKRHERLMEKRNADDWDGRKLENLAKNYIAMRREIWSPLAAQTGEKWRVVEQKCMSQGVKNLETAARSCARRERLLDSTNPNPNSAHHANPYNLPSGFENDSGYADDLDGGEYDADNTSERSGGSYGYNGGASHHHTGSAGSVSGASMNGMVGSVGGAGGMSGSGMGGVSMMDSRAQAYMMSGVGVQHQGGAGQMGAGGVNGQRLPSMDMGIDAIINRPSGGR